MIVTELYKGQGLGNQLACYITTRVIAKDRGYAFGIMHPERFKGADFLDLDFGLPVTGGRGPEGGPPEILPDGIKYYYTERKIIHPESGADIRTYDKNLVSVLDNTKMDGLMQDERYIAHRKNEIREWLKVREEHECYDYADDNTCVINFRGGEYARHKDFFLNKEYWENAVKHMLKINPNFRFIVITDDVFTAKKFFPDFDVFHFSIAKDYVVIKNAHYLILSNSSFAWFPAWLNENLKFCIAPKYWARHNISDGYWSLGYNITSGWHYLDREGVLSDYQTCLEELKGYEKSHKEYFLPVKIRSNFLVVSNYNNDIRWVPEYTENYLVYDRSDAPILPDSIESNKVIKGPNLGYNLYDYFTFIVDNYDNLPECTIFAKGNTAPRHVTKEYLDRIINNNFFTPIEDYKMHKPYWPTCFIAADGGFCEINNSWYMKHHPYRYFRKYDDFMRFFFKNPPTPRYTRFAPGGNYIVPRENILKFPKEFYENLKTIISHCPLPGEAHLVERALHTIWTCNFELRPESLHPIDKKVVLPAKRTIRALLKEKTPPTIKNLIKFFIMRVHDAINYARRPIDIMKEKRKEKIWVSKMELADYKKGIKIYDVFYLFNELDLLEIRLNILNDYVDYFVIIESTESFSGLPHELQYEAHKERFAPWKDKIIYYVVNDFPKDAALLAVAQHNSNVGAGEHYWVREFYQKESAKKALAGLADDDIVFISDCDEIWNPLRLKELTDFSKSEIIRPKQLAYYYYLNNRCSEINGWTGTIAAQYKTIRDNCLNDLRTRSKTKFIEIDSGGWHFGFMGGVAGAMKKLTEWQHPEYADWIPTLEERVKKNVDYRGRKYKYWIDESDLPEYILKNKDTYKKLFK